MNGVSPEDVAKACTQADILGANCGNGVVDSGESCDDRNLNACGQCNSACSGVGTGANCPDGMACTANNDCQNGTCNTGTRQCSTAANCGNGAVDTGELCDDHNTLACGQCNTTCSGPGGGANCPGGTGCATNADCTSNSCNAAHVCD